MSFFEHWISYEAENVLTIYVQTKRHKHGVKEATILSSTIFSLDRIILDELHQMLRIMDLLMNFVSEYAVRQKRAHLLTQICACIGVEYKQIESGQKGKKAEWSPLDGNQHRVLLLMFDKEERLDKILAGHKKLQTMKEIWKLYREINTYLHSEDPLHDNCSIKKVSQYEQKVGHFVNLVRETLGKKKVTPYLHALVAHVPSMIRMHRNIAQFSCSSQELKHFNQNRVFNNQVQPQRAAEQILQVEHRRYWNICHPDAFQGDLGKKRRRNGECSPMDNYKKKQRI